MPISIQFLGAAGMVTGSKYLLEVDDRQYLIDCGLFQGSHTVDEHNWDPLPLPDKEIDGVLITHAHIDHTGFLPRLVRQGYRGPIYATGATCALMDIMLPDSAHLQEQEAEYANKEGYSRHKPALPLYTEEDAAQVLNYLHPVDFYKPLSLEGITVTWRPAGHILGSAILEVLAGKDEQPVRIVFSGDLGRYDQEIMRPPTPVKQADFLLVESTYGNREHHEDPIETILERIVKNVASRRGILLIPAFAVGRTQTVLYYLRKLEDQGRIPNLPVYVDSPLAIDASRIYRQFGDDHTLDANLLEDEKDCPLRTHDTRFIREVELSKKLNTSPGPAIIISASGMCNGGRIMHHLKWRLPDPRNTVLFVGYQAEGTRGRLLEEGADKITIHGQKVPVRATIESVDSLSSHADCREIMRWLGNFETPPQRTFVIHGEPASSQALQDQIQTELGWQAEVAKLEEKVILA